MTSVNFYVKQLLKHTWLTEVDAMCTLTTTSSDELAAEKAENATKGGETNGKNVNRI
jgi:hypothetical protein